MSLGMSTCSPAMAPTASGLTSVPVRARKPISPENPAALPNLPMMSDVSMPWPPSPTELM